MTLPFATLLLTLISCSSNQNPTEYASDYKEIVTDLFIQGNWNESIRIASIELRNPNISAHDQLFYLLKKGENFRFSEKYDSADVYFNRILSHPEIHKYPNFKGWALYGIGDLKYLSWSYFKVEEALDQAIPLLDSAMFYAEKSKDQSLISQVLYRSGSILQIQGEVEKSLANFNRGLEISINAADTAGIIRNDIHTASDLEELGQLDSALFHYKRAYELAKKLNKNYTEAHALCNLGLFYFDRNDFETAEEFFKRAQYISEELNHGIILCRSYYYLARLYTALNEDELSEKFLTKGLEIAKKKGYKNYENAFASFSSNN
ncbi:tetratricopeptide repeat protein [Ekhidna lutea]|nr:tetratricopeptide repeat protein [Ekhidna lutea]